MKRDALGDRMKAYEALETGRTLMPGLPIMARLDGRAFHTLTRKMERPYDMRFMRAMDLTAERIIEREHPTLAYTQSDEITLCWVPGGNGYQPPFGGVVFKLTSVLASLAAASFPGDHLVPPKSFPHFDCRVWNVPSLTEAYNVFRWREQDAIKNSISMLAQAHFSHAQLHGKDSAQKQDMLHEIGINWNDSPRRFKGGAYLKRVTEAIELDAITLARIPEKHRPVGPVLRSRIREIDIQATQTPCNDFVAAVLLPEANHGD